jgi:DNA-directed RNA polymerase specialized sigma24 family protein
MRYNEEDFETIYRATITKLSKHVFFKVQNLQDAQDLVQDIYYQLYRHMLSCTEKIENPQAYLIQMANNELTTYYQQKLRRPVTLIDDEIDLIESIPDDFDLETEVLNKITSEDLSIYPLLQSILFYNTISQ